MKNTLLCVLVALFACCFSANAQTYIGGSISFGFNDNGGSTASSLSISPDFGRFIP